MAHREGSVYLYLFIAASVLFVGMAVLFFLGNAEKQEITADLNRTKSSLTEREKNVKDLTDKIRELHVVIGGTGAGENPLAAQTYIDEELKKKAETAINEATKDLGEAARTYGYLTQPYADLSSLLLKYRQARDEAFAKSASAKDGEEKARQASEETIAKLREENKTALDKITELEQKYEDLDNKAKTEKQDLVKQIDQIKDGATSKEVNLNRTINWNLNTIGNLNARIDRLQREVNKEKTIEDIEPDGRLVSLLSSAGRAWIDLGRVNHLRKGLVFRVFQYGKGGKKHYKGRVEVQSVDEKMSEVRIVDEVDELDPIVGGDYVSSPFYDPKAEPVFVLAGTEFESREVTREGVIAKMQSYGAKIQDKVDLSADFLVAIKNYENTPEYKSARDLGVTIIRERDLLEFIGR
jgi:hypothetical protein